MTPRRTALAVAIVVVVVTALLVVRTGGPASIGTARPSGSISLAAPSATASPLGVTATTTAGASPVTPGASPAAPPARVQCIETAGLGALRGD